MLGAESGLLAVERGSIWRRNGNRRLRQREQETLRYRKRLSRIRLLPIEIAVMIYREVMSTAFKQPDNALCRMRVDIGLTRDAPTLGRRLSDSL